MKMCCVLGGIRQRQKACENPGDKDGAIKVYCRLSANLINSLTLKQSSPCSRQAAPRLSEIAASFAKIRRCYVGLAVLLVLSAAYRLVFWKSPAAMRLSGTLLNPAWIGRLREGASGTLMNKGLQGRCHETKNKNFLRMRIDLHPQNSF